MIDGRKIRINARLKARQFVIQSGGIFSKLSQNSELDSAELEEFREMQLRGALKAAHVKFKSANLDAIAMRHPAFDKIHDDFLAIKTKTGNKASANREVLSFLNNFMMIGTYGERSVPTEAQIGHEGMRYVSQTWDSVFAIFSNIVEEYEEFYFSDFRENTMILAGDLYLAKNQDAVRIP